MHCKIRHIAKPLQIYSILQKRGGVTGDLMNSRLSLNPLADPTNIWELRSHHPFLMRFDSKRACLLPRCTNKSTIYNKTTLDKENQGFYLPVTNANALVCYSCSAVFY